MPSSNPHSLLSDPIPQTLTRMGAPMALGIIAILTFNLVDTFFIGLLGTQALAAVSFTFPVTFMLSSILMGLGVGLSSVLAHTLGEGDRHLAAKLASHGILLGLVSILILANLCHLWMNPLFRLLGAPESLLPLIRSYMVIWFTALPLLAIPMLGNAAIRATGDTRTPAIVMTVAGLVNGVVDPLLIFGLGPFPQLGIQGAVIASALSWLIALVVSLYILRQREKLLVFEVASLRELVDNWRRILRIALPASLTNLLTPFANAILMMIFARFGTEVVAAYGAASRVESLLLIVIMALCSVLAPFVAQNTGAAQHQRSRTALFVSIRFSILSGLLLYGIIFVISPWVAMAFSSHPRVEELITLYLRIVPLGYGMQGCLMLLASALNGLQAPVASLLFNGMRLFVFVVPFAWLGSQLAGTTGIFCGLLAASLCSGAIALHFSARSFPRGFLRG
ncbi:MATE family efflux transporter [Dongshaea marina]|uniref:MATE family efflux transporter n=1 Tax=Dongshaea marina TaxID=2047966 RepID=UPI000D3EBDE5|nr:MATE family efflux transporter [Dongshaea marina]